MPPPKNARFTGVFRSQGRDGCHSVAIGRDALKRCAEALDRRTPHVGNRVRIDRKGDVWRRVTQNGRGSPNVGATNDDPDPSTWISCDQRAPEGTNFSRYCSAAVDRALRGATSVYDRAGRRRVYGFVQRRLLADVPYDFLWQSPEIDVIPARLHGFEPSVVSPYNSVAQWRL